MTYSIVYSSKTGNTKMLADALHQALPADDCLYFGAPDAQALAAERIYIGFWTDKGTCDAETAAFLAQLTQQEIFLFGTCGKRAARRQLSLPRQNAPERSRSLRAHRRRRARQAQPHAEDDLQFRLRPQPSRRQRPAGPHRRSGKLSEKINFSVWRKFFVHILSQGV